MAMSQLAAGGLDQQSASAGPSGYAQVGRSPARRPLRGLGLEPQASSKAPLVFGHRAAPAAPCLHGIGNDHASLSVAHEQPNASLAVYTLAAAPQRRARRPELRSDP